jgi:O-antigen ligase
LATGVLATLSLFLGNSSQGRLAVIQGKFSNPNDLAQALLIGLPFWWFMARDPGRKGFRFALAVIFLGFILVVLAKTGSRGGLAAFIVMLMLAFWRASARGKLGLIVGCAVMGLLGVALVPRALTQRYTSISASDDGDMPANTEEQAVVASAINSSAIRMAIFKESLRLTLMHPLFGVGPGMFTVASAEEAKKEGVRGKWLETHNTYTQISSEGGVPALIFYLSALFMCLGQTNSLYRLFRTSNDPRHAEIAAAVLCTQASLVAFGVTAIFSSVAYVSLFPTLAGLSIALALSVKKEAESLRATQRVLARAPFQTAPFPTVQPVRDAPFEPLRPAATPAVRARLGGRPRPASLR